MNRIIIAVVMLSSGLAVGAEKLGVYDCLDLSLRNNPDIKNAVLAFKQNNLDQIRILSRYIPSLSAGYTKAEINEPSASSPYNTFPMSTLSFAPSAVWMIPGGGMLKADYSDQSTLVTLGVPIPGVSDESHTRKLTFSVVQPLLRDFLLVPSDINILRMAASSRRIAALAIDQASQNITYSAYLSYISLVINDLNVALKAGSLERSRILLQKNEQNRSLGIVEDTDILGAKAALGLRIVDFIASSNQRNDAYNNLKLLINTDKDFDIDPDVGPICRTVDSNYGIEAEIGEALSNRIEIRLMKEQMRIQRLNIQNLRSKLLPQLNLIGSYEYYGNAVTAAQAESEFRENPMHSWTAGLQLSMPLFPLGEIEEVRKQSLELEKMANNYEKTVDQIRNQLVSKINEIRTLRSRLAEISTAVGYQRDKLQKESDKFKVGRSATRTVIMYQDDLENAETLGLQLKLQYYVAVASLNYLKGKLLLECDVPSARALEELR